MGRNALRRVVLYGAAVLVLSGLAYGGFVYEARPDYGQIVTSAETCASYGTPDEGIRWAEMALEEKPDDRYVHLILAHCYVRKEDYARAIQCYRSAIDYTPVDDPTVHLLHLHLAEAMAASGNRAGAIREAEAVTEKAPDLLVGWYLLSRLHRQNGDLDRAAAACRSAAERGPDEFEPPALLADIELQRGDDEEALKFYRIAERIVADRAERAAKALEGVEPTMENVGQRQQLALLSRQHAEIEVGLARVFLARGAREMAEDRLVGAADLDPGRTARTLRDDEDLAPLRESERVLAALSAASEKK
jgi:tetratricopeptide (TPR) repeat protein